MFPGLSEFELWRTVPICALRALVLRGHADRDMQLTTDVLQKRLDEIAASGLLTREEMRDVLALLAPTFPAAAALTCAESVHLHVRVDDVAAVRASLAALGEAENEKPGYVKLRAEGGVHLIVSSIEVAEEDRVATLPRRARPHLDHVGVDLRDASPPSREAFDAIATRAEHASWRAVHQGGAGASVACCHASVSEKRWLFPPTDSGLRTPIEVAFGPLERGEGAGTDLRPLDPKLAEEHIGVAACCAPPRAVVSLGRKRS